MEGRKKRALDNARAAIDMHEIFERVTARNHKSFLVHGAIYKVSRDILQVSDVWAFSTSSLELQNAETKRTASSCGSRRLQTSSSGVKRAPLTLTSSQGPANLVKTKGYSSTMALSTLKHLLVSNVLKRGCGLYELPETRRNERLFGVRGKGRITLPSSGVKLEARVQACNEQYMPREDTCLKAFIRLLSVRATAPEDGV